MAAIDSIRLSVLITEKSAFTDVTLQQKVSFITRDSEADVPACALKLDSEATAMSCLPGDCRATSIFEVNLEKLEELLGIRHVQNWKGLMHFRHIDTVEETRQLLSQATSFGVFLRRVVGELAARAYVLVESRRTEHIVGEETSNLARCAELEAEVVVECVEPLDEFVLHRWHDAG